MVLKTASLPPEILNIIQAKGTEMAFSGEYDSLDQAGSYLCHQCGLALFRADTKFHSGCGWPSFDQEIPGAVSRHPDADGQRTEVVCSRCNAHLGHVFQGEGFTAKNIRHCINSLSLDFVTDQNIQDTEEAIVAAGCFWGVERALQKLSGVVKTEVGYTGGHKSYPTYEAVCAGNTGHVEAVRVLYDPQKLTYEALIRYFFELHDATQPNGQGPDIGEQYLSKIFHYDATQKAIAEQHIEALKKEGIAIATRVLPVNTFWRAEDYHQNYLKRS